MKLTYFSLKSGQVLYSSLKAALIYAVFGILWIIFSDKLMYMVAADARQLDLLQTYKGSFFIFVTSGLFFFLIYQALEAQRRNQEILQRSEERLSYALIASNSGLWDWDIPSEEVFFDANYYRISGYEPDEFPHEFDEWRQRVHPDDIGPTEEALQAFTTGESDRYWAEFRFRKKGGDWMWILSQGKIFARDDQGKPLRLTGTHMDISQRKQAEAKLERLLMAIEQCSEVIVVADPQGVIEYVNPAFETVTGYRREEVLGKNPRVLKSGEHADTFYEKLWETIRAGQPWQGRFVNRRKDGAQYTEVAAINPVKDRSGKVVHFIAVKQDVTEQMQLESQLRQSQKLSAVGTLASGIAHDFNNILTTVLGYSDMIQRYADPGSRVAEDVQKVIRAGERAQALVAQMLSFTRQKKMAQAPVALRPLVKEVLSFVRLSIPASVDIRFNSEVEDAAILADPIQVHQILMNLCINAYQAMRGGAGSIDVSLAQVESLPLEAGGGTGPYLKLLVKDDGHGIPEEIRDKIFDPFFTTKEVGQGSGLGLSAVYGEVRSLGGRVLVQSAVGKGSEFAIYLPVTGLTEDREAGEAQDRSRGCEKILLLDDETDQVDLAKRSLEERGYRVRAFSRPEEALAALRQEGGFDLLITDHAMPGMTGVELAREAQQIAPGIPVVLCSGLQEGLVFGEMEQYGIKALLQKPHSYRQLPETVRRLLDQ